MTYDLELAARLRKALAPRKGVSEKRMFGGLSFMLDGNMCCGILDDDLVVRLGPNNYENALAERHARPMDFTGRPHRGMVYVGPEGCETDKSLSTWVDRGVEFAASMPPK